MIIKDELPFRFVEAEGFLEFMERAYGVRHVDSVEFNIFDVRKIGSI